MKEAGGGAELNQPEGSIHHRLWPNLADSSVVLRTVGELSSDS